MREDTNRALVKKFVKELPFFRSLSDRHLNQLSEDFIIRNVKKGETIFYQSDNSTDLYIVLNGVARASLLNQEGQELILSTFKEGDFFGEMSLLDGKPRSATIIAVEATTLGILRRERFLFAIKDDPIIAIDLLSALVQRLRIADEMIGSLAFLDVSQRLVKLLLEIAKAEGEKNKNGVFKIKKITHRELAARTGASREAVSKVLKVLSFKNIVTEESGCFFLAPDSEKLCQ